MDESESKAAEAVISSNEPEEADPVLSSAKESSVICEKIAGVTDAVAIANADEDDDVGIPVGTEDSNLSEEETRLEVGGGDAVHEEGECDDDDEDKVQKVEADANIDGKVVHNGEDTNDLASDRKNQDEQVVASNAEEAKGDKDEGSDGEIVDSDVGSEDEYPAIKPRMDYAGLDDVVRPEFDQLDYDEDVDDGEIKSEEESKIADAKAEEKHMSDGEIASSDGEVKSDSEDKKQMGETQYADFEEGEMIDPSGRPTVPREICRFFERGHCTYGDRCRFIHPGINDKGGYRMFDDEKPRPPMPGPPMRFPLPADPRAHPAPPNFPPPMMLGPPPPETAWERGLRHAKEMRRRAMQRKVEEPDFMRKREVLSLNEALNVDRDMDYIAQKPLAEEDRGGDPFVEEDERYATPSLDEIKKYKRFDKSHKEGRRSPGNDLRRISPPRDHFHRDVHERNRDRRSPPRHPGGPPQHYHDRHQPMPTSHHSPHMRHDYRDRREGGGDRGRHERDYRDRRMNDHKERDYRMESRDYPVMESKTSPRRHDVESRVVPVQPQSNKKKTARGDTWSDPWARGRQSARRKPSRSDSESSGSSSSSSRSSYSSRSGSSFSSRSSSRSSYSSSYSSSASSRSPSPQKTVKKKTKTKKVVAAKAGIKAKDTSKTGKPLMTSVVKQTPAVKKTSEIVKAKLNKNAAAKPPPKSVAPAKPIAKGAAQERGRVPVKTVLPKGKQKKKYDSSSSSEFSHSSSSESRSRSRGKGSASDSDSGSSGSSSSGSESYSSSSSSSSASSDEEVKRPKTVKKKAVGSKVSATGKKSVAKVSVPSKPGNKSLKMTINDKAKSTLQESRKRPAAAMSNQPPKKVSAIANRRVELLEQLKVVENAILKKRAKLT